MKRLSTFLILFLGLMTFVPYAHAQGGTGGSEYNPTSCEFQPPAEDRSVTVGAQFNPENHSSTGTWTNYAWDETYPGFHIQNAAGWPGIDIPLNLTVPFKNGGTVEKIWYDSTETGGSTGGNSITIKGEGICDGWIVYMGHLDYDAATRFRVGQHIGPDEVVGVPGCSGFEERCEYEGGPAISPELLPYPKHVHLSLGYRENVFDFGDGTVIVQKAGYYWVPMGRMEDTELNKKFLNPPAFINSGELKFDKYKGWYVVEDMPVLEFLNVTMADGQGVDRRLILFAGIVYCLIGLILYSNLKNNLVLFSLVMIVLLLVIGIIVMLIM